MHLEEKCQQKYYMSQNKSSHIFTDHMISHAMHLFNSYMIEQICGAKNWSCRVAHLSDKAMIDQSESTQNEPSVGPGAKLLANNMTVLRYISQHGAG